MGVGYGSGHEQQSMEDHHSVSATPSALGTTPTIKEEAETSADSLTIDVEGHDDDLDDAPTKLMKTEFNSVEDKAWIQALRSHVVVPLIRHPKSISFRKPVDPIALGIYPSYNQIITHPMDLGTIKTRIDNGYYTAKDDLIADIQLVWNNAKKFNPIGHFVHDAASFLEQFAHGRIDKIKKDGPHSISRPIAPLPPPRETSKRDVRKKSLDLPGETQLPQHLEQNRNATGSMRACETLLRNLMTQKIHRDYVEPFIYVDRKGDSELYNPMSLSKVQSRLKSNGYNHPMEFADDVRRIITETYRYCTPQDPLIELAGKLQSEFEMMFAKIDYNEDEIVPTIYSGLSEDDRFIGKLLAAQNFMMNIQTEVTKLIQDYMKIRQKDRKRKQKQIKRKSGPSPVKPPAKRAKKAAVSTALPQTSSIHLQPQPKTQVSAPMLTQPVVQQGMLKTRKNNLTLEDGNRLKQQIASLTGEQQMTVLEILKENNEHLEQDDEGNVEMEFREFSQKSVDDLKDYVKSVTSGGAASAPQTNNGQHNKKAFDKQENSESESDSSSSPTMRVQLE